MILPPAAMAQERTPTPSAEELWKAYPLQQQPTATADPAGREAAAREPARRGTGRPASARTPAPDGDGAPLLLLGATALLAVGAATVLRHQRARPPRAAGVLAIPLLATAATSSMSARRHPSPRLTSLAGDGGDAPEDDRPVADLRPPDPTAPWTAEIEWHGDGPRFSVTAYPDGDGPAERITSSAPLEWPPSDAVAVHRLRRTVARIESAMRDAGWTPPPPGEAWYSKRFAWAPVAAPAHAPAPEPARGVVQAPADAAPPRRPAPAPEPPARRGGLFAPQPEWPEGAEQLWRCEIRWRAGYVNSRFTVVARQPGRRSTTTVSSSQTFKWLIMADPDPPSPEFRDAVIGLDEQIRAAGWQRIGTGRDWWELRYVWRGEGEPALDLDPAPVRIGDREEGDDDET